MQWIDRNTPTPKALVDLCILEIILTASEEHPLTQNDIRAALERDYGLTLGRKSLHLHLDTLVEKVPAVRFAEKSRVVDGEQAVQKTGFWMESEFDESELRALIYGVIFSKHMPTRAKKDLVEKLEALSASGLRRKIGNYILEEGGSAGNYNQLFWNLEELSRAIETKRKVTFDYPTYEFDDEDELLEVTVTYTVSPLGIGTSDSDYYLAAMVNGAYGGTPQLVLDQINSVIEAVESGSVRVDTFRIDKIRNVNVLDEPRDRLDPPKSLKLEGARGNEFDMQEYVRHNSSLSSGHVVDAKFRFVESPACTISDVMDRFGKSVVRVQREQGRRIDGADSHLISVRANNGDVRNFALGNAANVEILKPDSLRDQVYEVLGTAYARMTRSLQEGE